MGHITAKGIESRSKLFRAAVQQFALKGYHETKVSDIVGSAGVTQAAFYLYFSSKEAIFNELIENFTEQLKAVAQSIEKVAPLSTDEVPGQIYENLKSIFTFLAADPDLTKVAWYQKEVSNEIKNIAAQFMAPKIIGNQNAGHIRSDLSPDIIADFIIGMVSHLTEKWLLSEKMNPEQLASEAIKLLLYGVLSKQ